MAALGILRSFYYLTDSFWVGRLGSEPLTALGGSAFGWWMIVIACELAATGAHSLIARQVGAGERHRIRHTLASAFVVGLIVAGLLAAAYPARELYFALLGFDAGSAETMHGSAYLGASLLGASSLALHAVVGSAFRGLGDTVTALVLTVVTLVINAALDPVLIWGLFGAPALGVAGAAWATALANVFGAGLGALILHRRGILSSEGRPNASVVFDVARIGAPIAGSGFGFALVYVLLGNLITGFGPEQIAALGVGHRLEAAPYFCCVAFGVGAATMVGQHQGAGNQARARACARAALRLALLAMVPFTLLLFVGAELLFSVFTSDQAIVDAGVVYLRIQTAVLAFMALEEVYKGAFTGTGKTLAASIVSFGFTAIRLPAAWLVAVPLGWGIEGLWAVIAASTLIKGTLLWLLWLREIARERTAPDRAALRESAADRSG